MKMMKIGFIGLGIMGKPMAHNLLKAGYEVKVYNRSRPSMDFLATVGGIPVNSPKEAADGSDVIITMLPNSPDVKQVVMGENGVLEGAKEGAVLIDMSSIAPLASKEICEACAAKGVRMLDAPVSGGEGGAIAGTLSIMVGGDPAVLEEVHDVLAAMGTSIVHCGDIGAGNSTKLANQIIAAVNIAAFCEAFTLATKAGVDPEVVFNAIKGGFAGSNIMNVKAPQVIDRNFKPGFKVDLHIKDLNNVIETGEKLGTPLPLAKDVIAMLKKLSEEGYGNDDHSSIIRYYEELAGVTVTRFTK